MLLRILLFIALFATNFIVNAQNKHEYDQAVDYCACRISYAYAKQYVVSSKDATKAEKESFHTKIEPIIENCNINDPISYRNLSKLLSGNYFPDYSKKRLVEINKIKKFYSAQLTKEQAINTIIDGIYSNGQLKNLISDFPDIGKIKGDLINELDNSLNSFADVNQIRVNELSEKFTAQIDQLKNEIRDNRTSPFSPNWLSIILIILLLILFFFKNNKVQSRLDRHRNEIRTLNSNLSSNDYNRKNSNSNQFETSVTRNINALNDTVTKIQIALNNISKAKNPAETSNQENYTKTQHKVFYAPAPNKSGEFNSLDISPNDKDSKFYKFIISDKNSNEASFEFYNYGNSTMRALNSPEPFLFSVCEPMESLNQDAKRIITEKPGFIIKTGDKWIVKEKAEIRYE